MPTGDLLKDGHFLFKNVGVYYVCGMPLGDGVTPCAGFVKLPAGHRVGADDKFILEAPDYQATADIIVVKVVGDTAYFVGTEIQF
jgi:hypothetical protein